MLNPSRLEVWQAQREQLKTRLMELGDLRPGSLVERFRKCGRPTCHCAQAGSRGHGPCYSLTHAVGGKTVTRIIPKGAAVERTRRQIAEYHRLRNLVQELIAVNEQLCDAQLSSSFAPAAKGVKKNFARGAARHRHRARN